MDVDSPCSFGRPVLFFFSYLVRAGCAHFTFWPDGGCLLTGPESLQKAAPYKYSETITGPKWCHPPASVAAEITAATEAAEEAASDVESGVQEAQSTWGAGVDKVQGVVPPAGVNGTSCSAYPACVPW